MGLRLSQTQTVLVVAGGLLLLANVYLGLSYLSAQDQKGRLDSQYRALEQSLARLVGAGETDPADATAQTFPKDPPGIQLTDLVIRTAQETGTEILGMHSSAVVTEQVGSNVYRVMKINVRLRSDPRRLASFFERLERGAVSTMVFDNIDVARTDQVWDVSMDLLAYSQGT